MGPQQVFHVLTEFRFEVGAAVANTSALKSAVEGVSSAADTALINFQKLGLGVVASMGLGSGSLLGVLGAAIQSADKFSNSQRQFANIISSNMEHLTGSIGTFEERMAVSESIMRNINKLAQEFSLPSGDLLEMSKLLSATLVPKGLAGTNFGTAIDISRNFLKASPTLGIDPTLAQGQLLDLVQGRANLGDTLFQRLMNETTAFKPFNKQGGPQAFNQLDAATRVKLLGAALKQFSSDVDVLKGNANSLSGEMRRLGEAIRGPFSILKPLGDVVLVPLLDTLHRFNNGLAKEGAGFVQALANFIGPLIKNPEQLLIGALQARKLSGDVRDAAGVLGVAGMAGTLGGAIKFLGGSAKFAHPAVALAAGSLAALWHVADRMNLGFAAKAAGITMGVGAIGAVLAYFGYLIPLLSFAFNAIAVPLGLLIGLFQLLARSAAIAQVADAKAMVELAPRLMESLNRVRVILGDFVGKVGEIFNGVAEFLSPLFRMSFYVEGLVTVIDAAADGLLLFQATFQGLVFAILETVEQVQSFFTGNGFNFGAISDAFNAGIDEVIERNLNAIKNGSGAVVNQTTQIAKVEINNQFKEQMEPDRIAFTMKEQLMKAAQNPGQASGRSFSAALAR